MFSFATLDKGNAESLLSICLTFQVGRLEGQVVRYKTAAENAEKVEDELKAEKRKLQREVSLLFLSM